jgi:hypothetical protein
VLGQSVLEQLAQECLGRLLVRAGLAPGHVSVEQRTPIRGQAPPLGVQQQRARLVAGHGA